MKQRNAEEKEIIIVLSNKKMDLSGWLLMLNLFHTVERTLHVTAAYNQLF